MGAAIIGLLTALPELIGLLKSAGVGLGNLWTWINQQSGNDPAGFIVKIGKAFDDLNQAKTQEDHQNAAKALADIFHNLPSRINRPGN